MLEKLLELREKARQSGQPVLRKQSFEILISTVKEKQPKKILEVGTNVGLSSIGMLLTSKQATLTGIEIDEDIADTAKQNFKEFGVENRARILVGDANEIVPILSGKYDFIFLDGPKGHYYQYLVNLLPLLSVGGVIFADDVYFHGYVLGKAPRKMTTIKHSMEKFLQKITTDENLKTQVLEIEDGISITEKIR